MSPYIVTAKQKASRDPLVPLQLRSRRAVATLDEDEIALRMFDLRPGGWLRDGLSEQQLAIVQAAASAPEHGGTVGPLPDGTVIEVAPTVSWGGAPIGMARWLREQGWSVPASMDDAAAMDVYNEREAT